MQCFLDILDIYLKESHVLLSRVSHCDGAIHSNSEYTREIKAKWGAIIHHRKSYYCQLTLTDL